MGASAEPPVSPTRTAMTIGAITAALMLLVFATGLQIIGWLVFAGGIYCGMKRFRTETGGCISYFKALFTGLQTAFFASVILAFAGYVTATMEPALIGATLDMMEQQLQTSGVPSGLAETVMQQWREILSPTVLGVITIFMCSATGCIVAVVCAFFIRNDQPPVIR
ncbi:MAG: DUF4199 domain-containing protein [Bacteroidales bacterium]|jgi:hypothetical protein|nr:DUF4199 domain-containing protein [Bacteroidales bacterium]